jgi:hypothetical protein
MQNEPHPHDQHTAGPGSAPAPRKPSLIILQDHTRQRRRAYTRASRAANTTLANWMFSICDKAAGIEPE